MDGTIAEVTCAEPACTACVQGNSPDEVDGENTRTAGCDGFGYYDVPEFKCDGDGIYKADKFGNYHLYLPPVEKLTLGHSWEGHDEALSGFQSYTWTFRVIGLDPVSVRGQVCEGVQIERRSHFRQQSRYVTMSHVWMLDVARMDVDVLTFARGVGLVQVVRSNTECVYVEGEASEGRKCNPVECSSPLCAFTQSTSTTNLTEFSIPP
jgi:hypothetical protein